jgi:predicted secreted Zn-dependent protease
VQVEVSKSTRYYQVYGSTSEELFAYMENYGPVDDTGQRGTGVTTYESRLDWGSSGDSRNCAIARMTIEVELEVTLPRLADGSRISGGVLTYWNQFAAGVAAHEQRHVDIYVSAANRLKLEMLALSSGGSCTALEARVNSLWESHQRAADVEQEQFHKDERARIEAARGPLRSQLDTNRSRLGRLTSEIARIDENLKTLTNQIDSMKVLLDSLQTQLKAIEDRYPGQALPDSVNQQYESLRLQYNNLVPSYNALINQYNLLGSQRTALISEADILEADTNRLIEEYNWTR